MTTIGIILGSTRPGRVGPEVANWVHRQRWPEATSGSSSSTCATTLSPTSTRSARRCSASTSTSTPRAWARTVSPYDGYVFVTAEYNHGTPGVLKNAIDYLHAEWRDKAVGLVSYGIWGRYRSRRAAASDLWPARHGRRVPPGRTDAEQRLPQLPGVHTQSPTSTTALALMLDQVVTWSQALAPLRQLATAS